MFRTSHLDNSNIFDEYILFTPTTKQFLFLHNNDFISWLCLFLDFGIFLILVPFPCLMKCTHTHTLVVALRVP